MKRKKKRNRSVGLEFDTSASWSLVKVLADGSESVLESGLTWEGALPLAEHYLVACRPGETVSLREAPVFDFLA